MPTAADFDRAAVDLDRAAEDSEGLMLRARERFGPRVLHGGELSRLTHTTIDVAERTASSCAFELRELAAQCRTRAHVCREYERTLASYNRMLEDWRDVRESLPGGEIPGPRPARPPAPPAWVDL